MTQKNLLVPRIVPTIAQHIGHIDESCRPRIDGQALRTAVWVGGVGGGGGCLGLGCYVCQFRCNGLL